MNQHAENMRKALIDYKTLTDNAKKQIRFIFETYGKEAGEAEIRIQNRKLEHAKSEAIDTITKAGSAGYKGVEAWGHMNGGNLDNDDIRLLDAGLIDSAEFERLKRKHSGNYTMLTALKKYGERQNAATNDAIRKNNPDAIAIDAFNVRDIPTVDSRKKAWESAQTQALDMLNAMDGSGKYSNPDDWGAAFVRAAMPETLEHFGKDL